MIVMSTKFLANVMVLGVISHEGDVMPPYLCHGRHDQQRRKPEGHGGHSEALDGPEVVAGCRCVFQ